MSWPTDTSGVARACALLTLAMRGRCFTAVRWTGERHPAAAAAASYRSRTAHAVTRSRMKTIKTFFFFFFKKRVSAPNTSRHDGGSMHGYKKHKPQTVQRNNQLPESDHPPPPKTHTHTVTHTHAQSRTHTRTGRKQRDARGWETKLLVPLYSDCGAFKVQVIGELRAAVRSLLQTVRERMGGDVAPPPRSSSWVSRSSTLPCAWVYRLCDVIRFVSFRFFSFFLFFFFPFITSWELHALTDGHRDPAASVVKWQLVGLKGRFTVFFF